MKKNLLKEKLRKGGVAIGVLIQEPAFLAIEILGVLGFDYLYIDCQHYPMSIETVAQMVRAAELRDITPLVRVPQNVPEIILRYLDVGAMGIIIPDMNSAEVAQKAVRAVKYPPEGERSISSGRVADFGLKGSVAEYVKTANLETMVLGIVESREGVEDIEKILGTEGLDVVIIGLSDLSKSLGVPGQLNHPLVLKAVDKILATAKKTGKGLGVSIRRGETPQKRIEEGFRMIGVSLSLLISDAGKQFLKSTQS